MEMRVWRTRRNWSRERLAEALGMSVSRITDYERGYSRGADRQPVIIPRVVELALKGLDAEEERK